MYRSAKTSVRVFWIMLGATVLTWMLRGIGLLTAIPGGLLWFLIFATVATGIFYMIQKTRRW